MQTPHVPLAIQDTHPFIFILWIFFLDQCVLVHVIHDDALWKTIARYPDKCD